MGQLENEIRDFLKERGAINVGFATLETMAGGPPSSDLTDVLPEAKSAISFALPLDIEESRRTLAKKNGHNKDKCNRNVMNNVPHNQLVNKVNIYGCGLCATGTPCAQESPVQ